MRPRILLVEDEEHLAESLVFNLQKDHDVEWTDSAEGALEAISGTAFDLYVLDVMLPGEDGFSLCKKIRARGISRPILFLTARNNRDDRIEGFKLGCDDYLCKPFELEELMLRVKALLRRTYSEKDADVLKFGKNTVVLSQFKAIAKGKSIELTKRECELLKLLTDRDGSVVTRHEILNKVWGYDVQLTTRTIDNFIARLRNYFEEDSKNPKFIHSVWGVGYKFTSQG